MEEQNKSMQVSFLLRSSELEHIQVNIFDSSDLPLSSFLVDNYNNHSVLLDKHINHFYCIVIHKQQQIEDHIEIKINQNGEAKKEQCQLLSLQKKFRAYTISIQVQSLKEGLRNCNSKIFGKEETQLANLANVYLRKIQKIAIKRVQVEQLKRPIQLRQKKGENKQSLRKLKASLTILTTRKPDQAKYQCEKQEFKSSIQQRKYKRSKIIKYDKQSEDSDIQSKKQSLSKKHSKKCNTLFECQQSKKQESTVQSIKVLQKQNSSIYDLLLKAFDQSQKLNRQGKVNVKKVSKKAFYSHNNSLISATLEDIKKQKMAFQIIGSIKYDYTHRITPRKIENQPKDIKIIRHRKNQTSNIDLINTKRLLLK